MEKNTASEALKSLRDAAIERDRAAVAVERAVHTARAAGASWADVAMPLGITRQAAQQKYSVSSRELIAADRAEDRAVLAKYKAANTETAPETPSIFVDPLAPAKTKTPSRKVAPKAPAKSEKPAPALKKWTPESAQESYIDRRPMFPLESAGFKDGVAQPGTGKGPHNCPRCSSTNHKGDTDLIRAYPGECTPTKYDPRDIAAWLTSQPQTGARK